MEVYRSYEKYAEKAFEPIKASFPISCELFKIFGKTTLLLLSGLAASSSVESVKRIGDFGLRYTISRKENK